MMTTTSRRTRVAPWFALAVALLPWTAHADGFTSEQRAQIVAIIREALRSDPSILRDAMVALQRDEAQQRDAATRAALAGIGGALVDPADAVAGNPAGDVTIVEFYDVRCPYCRTMPPVIASVLSHDHGVKWVYKDIPVLGPASKLGARAELAAQRQGGFEKFHAAIMAGTPNITMKVIESVAERCGLDWTRLQSDMSDPVIEARLDANLALADKLGIDGTPVYVIGGRLLDGAMEEPVLTKAIADARRG